MSTVIATSLLPDSTANDTLTVGGAGDSVNLPGNLLTMNSLQDAGGNNTFVSNGSAVTSTGLPGAMKFISAQTASGAASLAFTSGLDSTYDVYCFKFIDMNPATDGGVFQFQMGSSYNTTMTTTFFNAVHGESGSPAAIGYATGSDQALGTSYQDLSYGIGNGADECLSGELHLFAPSSTTYLKNFYARTQYYDEDDRAYDIYVAGYFNTTDALSAASFKMNSGNFDGIIALYGISKS